VDEKQVLREDGVLRWELEDRELPPSAARRRGVGLESSLEIGTSKDGVEWASAAGGGGAGGGGIASTRARKLLEPNGGLVK